MSYRRVASPSPSVTLRSCHNDPVSRLPSALDFMLPGVGLIKGANMPPPLRIPNSRVASVTITGLRSEGQARPRAAPSSDATEVFARCRWVYFACLFALGNLRV